MGPPNKRARCAQNARSAKLINVSTQTDVINNIVDSSTSASIIGSTPEKRSNILILNNSPSISNYVSPLVLPLKRSTPRTKKSYSRRTLFIDALSEPAINNAEKETPIKTKIEGRRFFTIDSVQSVIEIASLHGVRCQFPKLKIINETKRGLRSSFRVSCANCKDQFIFGNDEGQQSLPINEASAWAGNATGIGFTALDHALSTLDVPFMNRGTYTKNEKLYVEDVMLAFSETLLENGKLEKEKAIELGQIDSDGIPWTHVLGDGQWSKRCYNQRGNALSGAAVVIGMLSKKPLFAGVRNKFCLVCTISPGKPHKCFKNWTGSSSSMETDLIHEAFRISVDSHGLRYKYYVGDGDSSVFAAIQSVYHDGYSYSTDVVKIQCKNHAIRRLNINLDSLTKPQSRYDLKYRKILITKLPLLGKLCQYAIYIHIENAPITSAITLKEDILAIPYHVFGDHSKCSYHFCKDGLVQKPDKFHVVDDENISEENEEASVRVQNVCRRTQTIIDTPIWDGIKRIFQKLASYSDSLMMDMTTNITESFNSHINKFSQGKRNNNIMRGGYNKIVMQATMSFQHGPASYVDIFKKSKYRNPSQIMIKRSLQYLKQKALVKPKKKVRHHISTANITRPEFFTRRGAPIGDSDYGNNAMSEDLPSIEIGDRIEVLIQKNKVINKQEQWKIHLETVGQYQNNRYIERKKHMITASVAGGIFTLKNSTSNVSTLDSLLYPVDLSNKPEIQWGKTYEDKAIALYSKNENVIVQRSGLFVSLEFPMLGASPDGLVEEDGIVEIKCPYIERFKTPTDTADRKGYALQKIKPTKANCNQSGYKLSPRSKYFNQVVMQLHITGRNWCDFVIWTQGPSVENEPGIPLNPDGLMHVTRINRVDTLNRWNEMRDKLIKFFMEDYGPEIVDSRAIRNMGYLQPAYRLNEIRAAQEKKAVKDGLVIPAIRNASPEELQEIEDM